MLGYSKIKNEVFTFRKDKLSETVIPKVNVDTQILKLAALRPDRWRLLKQLQGQASASYLKLRYGNPNTYVLLAFIEEELAHVEWIVPAHKLKQRYPFVSDNSYSIISCLTAQSFRGLRIYSSQIQKVVESDIPARRFWMWAASNNIPSLKGLRKAGGIKAGEFIQEKWFWGYISHVEYFPVGADSK